MKGFESYAWYGFFAPAKTPAEIIAKLNADALKTMKSPEWQKMLAETGSENVGDVPGAVRRVHQGRSREMGEGGERLRRDDGLTFSGGIVGLRPRFLSD